jgi:DNA replication and repair protein RecF
MIKSVELINYRNIPKAKVELAKGCNILIAPNGFGKTNFLEAIYFSNLRKVFRTSASVYEIVGPDLEQARIEIVMTDNNNIEIVIDKANGKRLFKSNDKASTKKKVQEEFKIVLFAPHSVDLVNGDPSIRRDDIDDHISQISKAYSDQLNQYKKVLTNRNRIIKIVSEGKSSRETLSFWTEKLAQLCSEIQTARLKFFSEINHDIESVSEILFHDVENVRVKYLPNLESGNLHEFYLAKFNDNLEKEIMIGKTLYGIHKDDFEINYDAGKSIRYYGSRGQQRIASFIIKCSQVFNIYRKTKIFPIMLIDDLMSELDEKHRSNISNFIIENLEQVVITGADIRELPQELISKSNRIVF